MEDRSDKTRERSTARNDTVTYLPGSPTLSGEPGRIERFVRNLFRRRGALRPVARKRDDT